MSNIEKQIIEILKKKPKGATIKEIAEELGINKMTALRYLEVLKTKGIVDYEENRRAKIWYVVGETSLLEIFKSEKPYLKFLKYEQGNILLLDDILMVVLPASFFSNIYDLYGEEASQKLYQLGYEFGKTLSFIYEINTGVKVSNIGLLPATVRSLLSFFLRGGFGELEKIEDYKDKMVIKIKNSLFPKILEGKGKKCHFLAGYIAGIANVLTGKNLKVYESKCVGEGYNYCEFVIMKNDSTAE
ncbi:NEQ453 [Nanoarchaeum equitans Kin4-M]|uniref:NEQ453 n=1 Tax=Nanoarchaeum equitans (strain Kin4-M) TaxID=228908 RepID=Q74M81_NANEQ|nr:NEQ453 [Nanoarchaeum equitans Kin4-M]